MWTIVGNVGAHIKAECYCLVNFWQVKQLYDKVVKCVWISIENWRTMESVFQ